MKAFVSLSACLLAFGIQISAGSVRDLTLFEKLNGIPQGWEQGPSVPASTMLQFRLAVFQENAHDFEQHVIDISTPGHPKYGMHMSREELKRSLRPSKGAKDALLAWLDAEGVSKVVDDGDWINFATSATDAERIMDTKLLSPSLQYSTIANMSLGSTITRTRSMEWRLSAPYSTPCRKA